MVFAPPVPRRRASCASPRGLRHGVVWFQRNPHSPKTETPGDGWGVKLVFWVRWNRQPRKAPGTLQNPQLPRAIPEPIWAESAKSSAVGDRKPPMESSFRRSRRVVCTGQDPVKTRVPLTADSTRVTLLGVPADVAVSVCESMCVGLSFSQNGLGFPLVSLKKHISSGDPQQHAVLFLVLATPLPQGHPGPSRSISGLRPQSFQLLGKRGTLKKRQPRVSFCLKETGQSGSRPILGLPFLDTSLQSFRSLF